MDTTIGRGHFLENIMTKKLTQEQAEKKSLNVGIKMVGLYSGCEIKTKFKCPFCQKIFLVLPINIWTKNTISCGCYNSKLSSERCKDPIIIAKRIKTRQIPKNKNSLEEKFPEITKEWHPTKNKNKTPNNICGCSKDKVWWLGQCGHEYQSSISNRTSLKNSCPFCAGRQVLIGFNDVLTTHPELCKEWDYNKNKKGPENYSKGSNKKVWWKCSKCNYDWQTQIANRTSTNETRCPKCRDSKGEQKIVQILDKYNIKYEKEKSFQSCKNKRCLPFDFYLLQYNICIEYNGQQHYKISSGLWKDTLSKLKIRQHRDQIKRNHCKNNNIQLIEIKYTDFDKIEEIITNIIHLSK